MAVAAATSVQNAHQRRFFWLVSACEKEGDQTLISGRINKPLSATGQQQAEKIANKLAPLPFWTIYCSDCRDAKETASIIGNNRICEIKSSPYLREVSFGELEGKPISSYQDIIYKAIGTPEYNTIEKRSYFRIAHGAENVQEAFDRIVSTLKAIALKINDQNIVVVTHARLISALVANVLWRDIDAVRIKNGGMVLFSYHSDAFSFPTGRGISIVGKTPAEGLFERSLLGRHALEEGWGKVPNARKERFISLADQYFSGTNAPEIIEELTEIYASSADHGFDRIHAVKEVYRQKLLWHVEKIITNSIDMPKGFASILKGILAPGAPYGNQLLLLLYEFGDVGTFSTYVHTLYSYFKDGCKVENFVKEWAKKVYQDFQDRKPVSFSMMAKLIHDKRISYVSLDDIAPFNDAELSFDILKKLAALRVKEAEDALSWAYYYDSLASEDTLGLSTEERFEGLRALAEQGSEMAQEKLAAVYAFNEFKLKDRCHLTETQRREGIARLQEIEKHRHIYYITNLYWCNACGDLPYGLSIQDRIDALEARAKRNDTQALNYLLHMCQENKLADQDDDLKWDATERVKKIMELESIANENKSMEIDYIGRFFAEWVRDNSIGSGENKIFLDWSIEKRMDWLRESAIQMNNQDAADVLADAYANDRLGKDKDGKLNLTFEERLAKLHELALTGNRNAALLVAKFYTDDSIQEIADSDPAVMEREAKGEKLIELILKGRQHLDLDQYFLLKEPSKNLLKLIFDTIRILKDQE